jgi:hypothetical protein
VHLVGLYTSYLQMMVEEWTY